MFNRFKPVSHADRSKAMLLWWLLLFYVLVLNFVLLAPYVFFIFLVKSG